MTVNMVVLLTFTGWVYWAANSRGEAARAAANQSAAAAVPGASASHAASVSASASASPTPTPTTPTTAQIEAEPGKYFGVTADDVPASAPSFTAVSKTAGVAPNMVEYYVNWTQSFSSEDVYDSYAEGALPVITWEPFKGGTTGHTILDQPDYSLSTIIDGKHDAYITQFAEAVKAVKVPIAIRFMHEMNGNWYPWSVGENGNTAAEFVEAWRHVWNVFHQVDATNVIWIWAPNVLRGAQDDVHLADVYPGDRYVDWIGMTAYEDYESTATELFGPTLDDIRQFTQKNLLITETGAQPNVNKVDWISSFLAWLPQQQHVIGFIWNEYSASAGARMRWGFDADSASLQVFHAGIKKIQLAAIPTP
jgi:beta-mannanase